MNASRIALRESIRDAFVDSNQMLPMKKLILSLVVLTFTVAAKAQTNALFNWSDPATLTPAYPAPNADNRYGEYISNVDFTNNGVTFTVKDDDVKEQSQRARFLYGYNTQTVEMRAYLNSNIVITAPEGYVITGIRFEGAKVDENYLEPYTDESSFKDGVYSPTVPETTTTFYVAATINCTATHVTITKDAGVDMIVNDNTADILEYFNLQGVRIAGVPHGIVIERRGPQSRLVKK